MAKIARMMLYGQLRWQNDHNAILYNCSFSEEFEKHVEEILGVCEENCRFAKKLCAAYSFKSASSGPMKIHVENHLFQLGKRFRKVIVGKCIYSSNPDTYEIY